MSVPNAPEHVSGRVEAVNPKGCKINGQWWNWSKFAEDLVPPERGQLVTLILDKSGFVRTVGLLDGHSVAGISATPTSETMQAQPAAHSASSSQKDRTITRLAILKAASEFGAARPNLRSGDVLAIAASWERWVNRDEETTYTLTDAF